jgi:dihydroxyacetone kinase-like predicted kinase
MTTLERLGADDLRAVVTGFRDALRAHQDAVNRLNVYPVPDGDTGTNMALTLESVVGELDGRWAGHGVDVHGHQPRLAHGARAATRASS